MFLSLFSVKKDCLSYNNNYFVFQMCPELTSVWSRLPLIRWLLFYCLLPVDLHFISLTPPPRPFSNCLGAMIYPLFNPEVGFLLQNYCCWPNLEKSERKSVWSPLSFVCFVCFFFPSLLFFLNMLFWTSSLKQMFVDSLASAVEKAYWLVTVLYNLPAAVSTGSCFSPCPTLLSLLSQPPSSQNLPKMWIFLPFEKNKSSVTKTCCLGCFFKAPYLY